MRTFILLLAFVALSCVSAVAFANDDGSCRNLINKAMEPPATSRDRSRVDKMTDVLNSKVTAGCIAELLLKRKKADELSSFVAGAYSAATKAIQQSGASAGGGGSTSLVSKNATAQVLSLASEYGALTESTSGATTTVSGTVDGIPLALEAHTGGLVAECPMNLINSRCINSGLLNFLGRISYSLALNINQGTQITGTTAGPAQGTAQPASFNSSGSTALTQATGRFIIVRPKVSYTQLIAAVQAIDAKSSLTTDAVALDAAAKVLQSYQTNAGDAWAKWAANSANALVEIEDEKTRFETWERLGEDLAIALEGKSATNTTPPTDAQLTFAALKYASALDVYGSAEQSFYEGQLNAKPILSFEYDENRPASQPTTSVFRLIYGQQIKTSWTLTANAAVSIYDQDPSSSIPGAQRLRDIQLAVEADYTLPKLGILGTPIASGAYYFQDQTSPAILNITPGSPVPGITFVGLSANATQAFAAKGKISVGQLRISLGNSQSGLRVPLAITFSNRTELTTGFKVGAQIGISYNFDSLFGK